MNALSESTLIQAVGWSLVHFVWQGGIVALLTWLLLAVCPQGKPQWRYLTACLAMLVMLLCPVVTTAWILHQTGNSSSLAISESPMFEDQSTLATARQSNQEDRGARPSDASLENVDSREPISIQEGKKNDNNMAEGKPVEQTAISVAPATWLDSHRSSINLSQATELISATIPTLTLIWCLGVCLLSLRLVLGWVRVWKLRNSGADVQEPNLLNRFADLKSRIGIRQSISLRQSLDVYSPMVIGWLRPVVLMPVASITGLNQQELVAVLAHELAHIRRADYLVNLLQVLIETLLFFHPAVWWVSKRIREERENCCDDLAVAICADKRTYIEALLKLENSRSAPFPLAVASQGGNLVKRVARLLGYRPRSARLDWVGSANSLAAVVAIAIVGILLTTAGSTGATDTLLANQDTQKSVTEHNTIDDHESSKIRGRVVDADGQPISRAMVFWNRHNTWPQQRRPTFTDDQGRFEISTPNVDRVRLAVFAVGHAPDTAIVNVKPKMEELDFALKPGRRLEVRFVNEDGEPIPDVNVRLGSWRGDEMILYFVASNVTPEEIPKKADQNGVFVWNWAPSEPVDYDFRRIGFLNPTEVTIAAGEKPVTVVMKRSPRIAGEITDINGIPIESFEVITAIKVGQEFSRDQQKTKFERKTGNFVVLLSGISQEARYRIKIFADGFQDYYTDWNSLDEDKTFQVKLQPESSLQYRIVDENNQPVANANVAVIPSDVSFDPNDQTQLERLSKQNPTTDEMGLVTLSSSSEPRMIVAFSEQGYGELWERPESSENQIKLVRWASIRVSNRPIYEIERSRYFAWPIRYTGKDTYFSQSLTSPNVPTGEEFHLLKITTLPFRIQIFDLERNSRYLRFNTELTISPEPGKETLLDFSQAIPVSAKIKATGMNADSIDWTRTTVSLQAVEPSIELPAELITELQKNGLDQKSYQEIVDWLTSQEDWRTLNTFKMCFDTYSLGVFEAGVLNAKVLRPGRYVLTISAFAKSESEIRGTPLGKFSQEVEIKAEPTDLGELVLSLFDDPVVGSNVEDFAFVGLDEETEKSLVDYQGKHVLLYFWTPDCEACQTDINNFEGLSATLSAKQNTTLISLEKNSVESFGWTRPTNLEEMGWIQGQLSRDQEQDIHRRLGVWKLPHWILIDPEGKYVIGGSWDEILPKIEKIE